MKAVPGSAAAGVNKVVATVAAELKWLPMYVTATGKRRTEMKVVPADERFAASAAFIHIPKNGGSSVEAMAFEAGRD